MQSIIMLLLFVGMFLVVQSVYEDKVRRIEAEYKKKQQDWTPRMYEPAETREKTRASWDDVSGSAGIDANVLDDKVYSPAEFSS